MRIPSLYFYFLFFLLLGSSCRQASSISNSMAKNSYPDSIWNAYNTELRINKLLLEMSRENKPKDLLFENVTLLSMVTDTLIPNQSVLIENGIISEVAPAGLLEAPASITRIDGRGKYLMPGLVDAHVHIGESNVEKLLNLATGVTTVREMAGFPWMIPYRDQINANRIFAPNLYIAGTMLNYNSLGIYTRIVRSAEEARMWVRRQKESGFDYIKVWNNMPLPLLKTIADEAQKQGLDLVGHVPHDVRIDQALSAGMKTLEHFKGYYLDKSLELTTENYIKSSQPFRDFWLCPTFATWLHGMKGKAAINWLNENKAASYIPPSLKKQWLSAASDTTYGKYGNVPERIYKMKREIFQNIIKNRNDNIIAGSDNNGANNFMVAGFVLHEELRIMNELGLSPLDVLKAATVNAAKALGRETEFGTIEAGKRADVLLLDNNPLEDLNHLLAGRAVMVRGIWISEETVKQILASITEIYNNQDAAIANMDLETLISYYQSDRAELILQPSAYINFGADLSEAGKTHEAVKVLRHALKMYPSYDMYNALGDACLGAADTTQAIQSYQISLEMYRYNRHAERALRKIREAQVGTP
ncbi:MAG: amidohydrolase family protein [Calditrichia bacterium]